MAIIRDKNFKEKEIKPKPITSLEIKHAVMHYFRFTRQWLCATECLNNDIMAFKKNAVIEVEVKISKYDLWEGEAKKRKHPIGERAGYWGLNLSYKPNLFYIAVPKKLQEEAEKWVNATSKKYGIIICSRLVHDPDWLPLNLWIMKSAKAIHKNNNEGLKHQIMKRLCSENIKLIECKIRNKSSK